MVSFYRGNSWHGVAVGKTLVFGRDNAAKTLGFFRIQAFTLGDDDVGLVVELHGQSAADLAVRVHRARQDRP